MDQGDEVQRPPITRVGPSGGAGRGLRTVVVLASVALALAVLKPWGWITAAPTAPGREGAAIAGVGPIAAPTAAATPASRNWAELGARIACLSGTRWLAVVDQVNGPVTSRSWTRLDIVPASDQLEPAIARTDVYAEAVPRIGFCAPGSAGSTDAGARFVVRVWRLTSGATAAGAGEAPASVAIPRTAPPGARRAVELVPLLISGGTLAEGGALFAPPDGLSVGGASARAADPEGAWAARGPVPGTSHGPMPGPARWRPDGGDPAPASWAPGTYVFRVDAPDAGPAGSGVAWFAIELRGPWTGPGESPTP